MEFIKLRKELARYRATQARSNRHGADMGRGAPVEPSEAGQPFNGNLIRLYVAMNRLHSTLDWDALLVAIQEIASDLIGSQQVAVFDVDPKNRALTVSAALGIDPLRFRNITFGTGCIGGAASTGKPYYRDANGGSDRLPEESDLTACIPLKLDGKVTGAVAIFRLLEQKTKFEASDYQIFEFLSTHAAVALQCAKLQAHLGASIGVTA